jgi:hypothetical protein
MIDGTGRGLVMVLRRDVGMKCKVHLLVHEHGYGCGC